MNVFSAAQLAGISQVLTNMFDTFGKPCRLYYQPKIVECDCHGKLPPGANQDGNHWHHGGFTGPSAPECPLCGGSGKKTQEYTENITLVLNWYPESPNKVTETIASKRGKMITRARIEDFPKISKCIKMQRLGKIGGLDNIFYKVDPGADDQFSIIQDKWIIVTWQRMS